MTGSLPARLGALAIATGLLAPATGWTAEGEPFYASKQITFIVGTGAGGGNDLYARVLAPFLARFIPGNPTIVVQNMPGSDGTVAAAHVYSVAPKDGTVIATSPSSMFLSEALNPSRVRFDSRKFGWVGTIATMTDVLAVFKSSGIETIEDAKKKEIVIGGSGNFGLSSMEPLLANAVLGTKFRVVRGYTGGDTVNLAMEQHEIEGRTNQWASWKVLRPEWIRDRSLSYLLQFGPKDPSLPGAVPAIRDLVTAPADRAMVDLLEIAQYMGRSVFAPPGLPPERLAMLRDAFDKTMQDSAFAARMKATNLELYPRTAREIEAELVQGSANRDKVVQEMKTRLNLN
jgi:tripartite-type tricarboxylate transporter receptor subunit TctC